MRGKKLIGVLCLLLAFSCSKDNRFEFTEEAREGVQRPAGTERSAGEESRHVVIMVSVGYNSLSGYLKEDIETLLRSELPPKGRMQHQLVIFSRISERNGMLAGPAPSPVLYSVYKDLDGQLVKDTLKVWDATAQMCDPLVFREGLELVRDLIPAKSYGMVYSSHASGWLPEGYFNDPSAYEREHGGNSQDSGDFLFSPAKRRNPLQEEFPPIPAYPAVKSIGQDTDTGHYREMELSAMCQAIPMHLDYLLLDACMCGCIEVASEFQEKVDIVGFSPTEVMADGFNYETLTSRLLCSNPDPVAVCQDYFEQYEKKTGVYRSATITAVDTRKLGPLTLLCKELFQKYHSQLTTMPDTGVQPYFRFNRHYFYDLKDILVHAGITPDEEAALDQALEACVLYKAATPSFMDSFQLLHVCGFSMYLPSMGTDLLDSFYKKNLAWNHATQLIQ